MSRTIDFSGLRNLRRPGDPGFAAAAAPFNKRYAEVQPAAAVSVTSAGEVADALGWARERGVPIAARGGGHSYAGHSVTSGLVLDLRGLDDIVVDPGSGLVTVGGGVRTGALYAALGRHHLAFPLGNSDDVGIGGLVLGGGVAAVSRAWGLTCDSLVATEVVLADGRTVRCDADEHPDLFWAARGAGGGNFGVHTSFTFRTRPTVSASTCAVLWREPHPEALLVMLQQIMADAPDAFAVRIGLSRSGAEDAVVSAVGLHLGSAADTRELLAPAFALAEPFHVDIADRDYWAANEFLRHATSGDPFAARTRCLPGPLGVDAVAELVAAVRRWPGSANPDGAGVALFTWGGAIGRIPVDDTAFAHRDTLFLLSMDTSWSSSDSPAVRAANLDWLAELHAATGRFAPDRAYLNFTDPDLADWEHAYHGTHFARLTDIKRRYDPENIFHFPQSIPPAKEPL